MMDDHNPCSDCDRNPDTCGQDPPECALAAAILAMEDRGDAYS